MKPIWNICFGRKTRNVRRLAGMPLYRFRLCIVLVLAGAGCFLLPSPALFAADGTVATAPVPKAKPETYGADHIGEMKTIKASYEDTLVNLARAYNLGFVELRAANPRIDPWLPGEGQDVILPVRHLLPKSVKQGVVINLPEMRLYGFLNGAAAPVTHPIGVGRVGLETPLGHTYVRAKKEGPIWRPTARMREEDPKLPKAVMPGPENPLGTHALYLNWPEYAIHGTDKPYGIGRRVSSGCIRLYPGDIKTFFQRVPVGTLVTVIDQPVKAAWIGQELYLEAHTSLTQADRVEKNGGLPPFEFTDKDMNIILKTAGEYEDLLDWRKIRQVIRERKGFPVLIATKPDTGHKEIHETKLPEGHEDLAKTGLHSPVAEKADISSAEGAPM